jgi:hypothetical protein
MLSRSLHRSVFGCVCRLAQWPALRGVLGTRSVLIVIRGGAGRYYGAVPHVCALVPPVLWGWQSGVCSGLGV